MNSLDLQNPNARSVALAVLLAGHRHDGFVGELLDKQLTRASLSSADRRLATQLAYGTLRRRGTLDALLQPCVNRHRDQVEPWLWETLRLGAYQLALLSHIPPHAALYETVELANAVGKPRGKGFLNGVLRKVASLLTEDEAGAPAADALPTEQGKYRRLSEAVLPDPTTATGDYLAAGFSWPRWLTTRWLERFGWDECVRLGFWFASPAPMWLRSNPLHVARDTLLSSFQEATIDAFAGDHPQSLRLANHAPVMTLPGFEGGWFCVQDESAMRIASFLNPAPGSRVLDMCAAPGGKTTHLAELMNNDGHITACDIEARRLNTVENLCQRLGVTIVQTHWLDAKNNDEPPSGPFDAALVDVPCSNTGVLGRRPEVRWRLQPKELPHLVRLQTKLLLQAAERTRSGGVIVYSTCSMEPEENENVVQAVLRGMPELRLEAEQRQQAGQPADGGYCARLLKT